MPSARAPMPAPQMIETPAMRRSAALAKALEDLRAPPQQIGGYGDLGARLLAQGITQWSKGRADKAVEGEKTAMREQFLASLPVAPEAAPSSSGPALAALLAPTPTNTQEPQQADIAPVAPVMGSPMPPAAPAGVAAAPPPMADVPPMPQAPAPAPAPQAAPAGGQMPPQLAAYIRQMAQTDLPGAQAVYGQWQQQQAMMSQLPDAIRSDPVAAWAATQAPAEVAESYGMRYRPTTTAAGSITSYGPGQNDPRVSAPVIERFDDRYGVMDPLNPDKGVQYTDQRGPTRSEDTARFNAEEGARQFDQRIDLDRDKLSQESQQFFARLDLDRETAERTGQNQSIERETGLRREFSALPEVRAFNEVSAAYQNVLAAANDPTAAGDLSLIFAYMKMLDPGSVVREQEFANAQNAAGVPDQIRNAYNRALRGERLNPAQRNDFSAQAGSLYANRRQRYDQLEREFTGYARDYGADPSRVVGGERTAPGPGGGLAAMPPVGARGATLTNRQTGESFVSDGSRWVPR